MNERETQIGDLFNLHAELVNKAIKDDVYDVKRAAEMFSDCFIAASPLGVNCGKNDKQLQEDILKSYAGYKKMGILSMEIISKEITLLDDFHAMVKVYWRSGFIKKDASKGSIEFDNIYFTQLRENKHKIFAYITGDEQAVLKKIGLSTESSKK